MYICSSKTFYFEIDNEKMKFIEITKIFERLKPEKEFQLDKLNKLENNKPVKDNQGLSADWFLANGLEVPDEIFNPNKSIELTDSDYDTVTNTVTIAVDTIKSIEDFTKHNEFEYSFVEFKDGEVYKAKETREEIKNLINLENQK